MRVAVTLIDHIVGAAATEDGRHMVLTLADSETERVALGIPSGLLPQLIDESARVLVESERARRDLQELPPSRGAIWCDLHRFENGSISLTFTLSGGGRLSFTMPGDLAERLHSALGTQLRADPEQSPTSRQVEHRGFV
jgi:hypothetical protein